MPQSLYSRLPFRTLLKFRRRAAGWFARELTYWKPALVPTQERPSIELQRSHGHFATRRQGETIQSNGEPYSAGFAGLGWSLLGDCLPQLLFDFAATGLEEGDHAYLRVK